MKTIDFGALTFTVTDGEQIYLTKYYTNDNSEFLDAPRSLTFMEFDVAGGITSGSNSFTSGETAKLKYKNHEIKGNTLTIIQESNDFRVTSTFDKFDDTNAVRVIQSIKNISKEEVCLEMANTLKLRFGKSFIKDKTEYYFHRFNNARYTEALPDVRSPSVGKRLLPRRKCR